MTERVKDLASQVSEQEGCRLYDIVLGGGRKNRLVLKVFIDHPHQPVTLEDCSRVSQALSFLLDIKDLVSETYELEVSSPGLERSLKETWHFEQALGKKVFIRIHRFLRGVKTQAKKNEGEKVGLKPRKSIRGDLTAVISEGVMVQIEGKEEKEFISFDSIDRAHVIFEGKPKMSKKVLSSRKYKKKTRSKSNGNQMKNFKHKEKKAN